MPQSSQMRVTASLTLATKLDSMGEESFFTHTSKARNFWAMIAVICVVGAGVLLLALDLCTDGHAHEFRAE